MERESTEEGKPQLEALIRERIEACGGITFAEFMEMCLYHPEFGYYTGERTRIGKGGDFFTSSSVHSLFGRLVARQLRQMWEILGRGPFTVVEQGAGEGHLCLDILDALRAEDPEFYKSLSYRLIEISPDNRRRQEKILTSHLAEGRVGWGVLEETAGFTGCFLSNELVDAFPVHRVETREGSLREVAVVAEGEGFAEELRSELTPGLAAYFKRLGLSPAEGSRAEVNLEAVRWMEQVGGLLGRGFVLTVDYGYPAAELYAPYRQGGTLMCYHRHQAGEDPYCRVGCQDITAHVDFTTLQLVGESCGLEPLYFGEQYRFLMGLGFVEALVELQAGEPDPRKAQALRQTLKNLILPEGGMGERFKVLVQGKGVGRPELLCSRSIRDIPLAALAGIA